jgi:hypothetical protein
MSARVAVQKEYRGAGTALPNAQNRVPNVDERQLEPFEHGSRT